MVTRLVVLTLFAAQVAAATPPDRVAVLLDQVASASDGSRQQRVDDFLAGLRGAPLVEEGEVVFLARADSEGRAPHIVSDANNWAQDTEDGSWLGDPMSPIEGTDVFYRRLKLETDTRLAYRVAYSLADQILDPLNPVSAMSFGRERSIVRMPGYQPAPESIGIDGEEPRGRLERHEFSSHVLGNSRTVHVYTPRQAEGQTALPVVFFHDGSDYIADAKVPQLLDRLLASERIRPLLAVFVDPVNRRSEYRMSVGYRRFFKEELIPWVDEHYPTAANRASRAIYGGSRGALGAADLVLSEPGSLSHCICFSPATRPTNFLSTVEAAGPDAASFFILIARYDLRFRRDGVSLADLLVGRGYDVNAIEISDGHSVLAWRQHLGRGLRSFRVLIPRDAPR